MTFATCPTCQLAVNTEAPCHICTTGLICTHEREPMTEDAYLHDEEWK